MGLIEGRCALAVLFLLPSACVDREAAADPVPEPPELVGAASSAVGAYALEGVPEPVGGGTETPPPGVPPPWPGDAGPDAAPQRGVSL